MFQTKKISLLLCIIFATLIISSCAMLTRTSEKQPISFYVKEELEHPQAHVEFESNFSKEELLRSLLDGAKCLVPNERVNWSMPAPNTGILLFGTVDAKWSLEVSKGEGRVWIALILESGWYSMPTAVLIKELSEGGSRIKVTRANRKKIEEIQSNVEDGTYFCHWRETSYPYD